MPILVAAVVVLAVLVVFNLFLATAVIRRLRSTATGPDPVTIEVGAPVPAFVAVRSDGARFDTESLLGHPTLVSFFSTTCRPCLAEAPELARRAGELSGRGLRVVPVLMSEGDDADGMARLLEAAGPLITEVHQGPVARAFQALATPSYVLVGADGRVAARGGRLEDCLAGR